MIVVAGLHVFLSVCALVFGLVVGEEEIRMIAFELADWTMFAAIFFAAISKKKY